MKSNIPFKQRKSFKKHGLKQCGPTNSRSFFRKDMPKRSQASFGNPDNIPASSNKMPSRLLELAASEARLRAAAYDFVFNVRKQNVAGWGEREIQVDASFREIEKALSTPPSDALKPWVELAKHCQNSDVIQNYLANGRPHGSNRVNPDGCECDDCQQYDHLAKIDKQARQLLESIGEKV